MNQFSEGTKAGKVRDFLVNRPLNSLGQRWGKQTLARELSDLYGGDVESWRKMVRIVTGSSGERKRTDIKDPAKTKFFYNGFEKWATENLNTEERPFDAPFVIPASIKKLSIIADLHSVHMEQKVMNGFLRRTKDKTAVLINGDLMDSESLSRHLKGHNVVAYEKELSICHEILKGLKQEFDHVYFKAGNHDFWLDRYLLTNAREVFRALGTDLFLLLKCAELGVHTIHNLKYIEYGDLDIVHGHEFPGFGMGKFPAVGLLDRWQTFKHSYEVKPMPPKKVRVQETKLGRERVHADVTYTEKKALIRIDPRQNGLGKLDALIHELLHLARPELAEGKVRKTATFLAKGIWKQNYRKI